MKSEDGTKDRMIRKEFNDFCRASMPYEQAKKIIAQAVKNDYSEAFCNAVVDGNR